MIFFSTLPFKVKKECLTTGIGQVFCNTATENLRFFRNEQEEPNLLNEEIKPGDKILITYGNSTDEQLKTQFLYIPTP